MYISKSFNAIYIHIIMLSPRKDEVAMEAGPSCRRRCRQRSAMSVELVETNGAFLGFLVRAKDTCASCQVA
jgi:hypothetical protein